MLNINVNEELFNVVRKLAECQPHEFSELKMKAQELMKIIAMED